MPSEPPPELTEATTDELLNRARKHARARRESRHRAAVEEAALVPILAELNRRGPGFIALADSIGEQLSHASIQRWVSRYREQS